MQENEYAARRQNFVRPFQGNPVQAVKIPKIAAELFSREFGITITDPEIVIPIVFSIGWKHILQFVKEQPSPEFAIDVCGMTLEYVTEYSESDKPTNIVPQMYHKKMPIFVERDHQQSAGATINEDLLNSYNTWRTNNLTEVLDKIEQATENDVRTVFGIYLMQSAAMLPIIAAAYAAGVEIAKETHETVNMYEIFEIDVFQEDNTINLTPLAYVKQGIKDDAKK